MKKSLLILVAITCRVKFQSFAQDKPFRIGTKIGFPNLAGLNLEYVTPALNGKLSTSVDGSYIPISISRAAYGLLVDDFRVAISYFELGPITTFLSLAVACTAAPVLAVCQSLLLTKVWSQVLIQACRMVKPKQASASL